jgi:hypothetical protein
MQSTVVEAVGRNAVAINVAAVPPTSVPRVRWMVRPERKVAQAIKLIAPRLTVGWSMRNGASFSINRRCLPSAEEPDGLDRSRKHSGKAAVQTSCAPAAERSMSGAGPRRSPSFTSDGRHPRELAFSQI